MSILLLVVLFVTLSHIFEYIGKDFQEPFLCPETLESRRRDLSWQKLERKMRYFRGYSKQNYQEFIKHFISFRDWTNGYCRCDEPNVNDMQQMAQTVKNSFHSLVHSLPPSEIQRFNSTQRCLAEYVDRAVRELGGAIIYPQPYNPSLNFGGYSHQSTILQNNDCWGFL